jgi:hypothetical protein
LVNCSHEYEAGSDLTIQCLGMAGKRRSARRTSSQNSRRIFFERAWQPPAVGTVRFRFSGRAGGMRLQGNCFRARRTGSGQNADGRRGVSGSVGSEGRRKDDFGCPRCSEERISWGEARLWRHSCAQALLHSYYQSVTLFCPI